MRLISDGPDIPDELIHALEAEQLVLFCGAGISMPAMPDFETLVQKVYGELHEKREGPELTAFEQGAFDRTLHLLERRIGRACVRAVVVKILTRRGKHNRHQSILELGRLRGSGFRLVTTNFDRLFEQAAKRLGYKVSSDAAPKLPIPETSRWQSLVYLHGKIPVRANKDDPSIQELIYTSGDFGKAYITHRWASRFVTELFKNFSVLFIGYSADDPVMRYLLDAFAADQDPSVEGASPKPIAWAFDGYDHGAYPESELRARWKAKGVHAIPYAIRPDHDHSLLYDSLAEWAQRKKHGLNTQVKLVTQAASIVPVGPITPTIEGVKWALSSRAAAAHFSKQEPPAPIEWLPLLEEWGFLRRVSGVQRVFPLTSWDVGIVGSGSHENSEFIMRWASRHLGNRKLLHWVLDGGVLTAEFRRHIDERLHEFDQSAEQSTDTTAAPLCDPHLKRAWRILTNSALRAPAGELTELARLRKRLRTDAEDPLLIHDALRLIAPVLRLEPARTNRFFDQESQGIEGDGNATSIREYLDGQVVPACGSHISQVVSAIRDCPNRENLLVALADDLSSLLKRALDLFALVDRADENRDPSYLRRPAIRAHPRNRDVGTWIAYIDLVRDAWLAMLKTAPNDARAMVSRWRSMPYPLFQRLALHAYASAGVLFKAEGTEFLLSENRLWESRYLPESLFLLRELWKSPDGAQRHTMINYVLAGPSNLLGDDADDGESRERSIWLRLALLKREGGEALGGQAEEQLAALQATHPGWILSDDDRELFPIWWTRSAGRSVDITAEDFLSMPLQDVLKYLRDETDKEPDRDGVLNEWMRAVKSDWQRGVEALTHLCAEGKWIADVWRETLLGLRESEDKLPAFEVVSAMLLNAADEFIVERTVAWAIGFWLPEATKELAVEGESPFWELWRKLTPALYESPRSYGHWGSGDPVLAAINEAPGLLTEALLQRLYARAPAIGAGLPPEIEPHLTQLTDTSGCGYRFGRVILASHLQTLFALAPDWTKAHILPWFSWSEPAEASAVWRGFLSSGACSTELFLALKPDFFDSILEHASDIHDSRDLLWQMFIMASLEFQGALSSSEARDLLRKTDSEGRQLAAEHLWRIMPQDPIQGAAIWGERVAPWFLDAWPKDFEFRDPRISEWLSAVAAATGNAFPQALTAIDTVLVPANGHFPVTDAVSETKLPELFPREVLKLIHKTWPRSHADPTLCSTARELTDRLIAAMPALGADTLYIDLDEYLKKHGL
ncbi:SIR2 family protein [Methylolobus aquaticus]